eukprot:371718_1
MSRQDLLVHHVHDLIKRNEPEEEIIAILTSHKIPKAEVNEILNICRWKSNYNTLPKQFVAEVLHFIHYYDSHRNPSEIGQQYLHHVFPFLSGADLVSLHIAFGKRGQMIEDFCKQYITQNPVMGVVLNINDRYNFPAYQPDTTHNYKFLYHLLFCYPDVHILGGYYSRSGNTELEPQTCIALYHHRQYLIEKALKGGGIAFCLNVLNRIVFDEKYERARAPKPKSILPSFFPCNNSCLICIVFLSLVVWRGMNVCFICLRILAQHLTNPQHVMNSSSERMILMKMILIIRHGFLIGNTPSNTRQ